MMEISLVKNKINEQAQRFFVTGVSLVTSYGPQGQNVMAAEWTMQVSYEPMLLAVFIHDGSCTLRNIKKTKYFGVNVASETQSGLVSIAGGFSGNEIDKLRIRDLFPVIKPFKGSVPLIEGCVINAECKLFAIKKIGDHNMVVGRVLSIRHDQSKKPLLYHRNRYLQIGTAIVPERESVAIKESQFDEIGRHNENNFILKFVGVLVRSKDKVLVLGHGRRNLGHMIPCIQPKKGSNYKDQLENHLHNVKLKISIMGDPMVKRLIVKNKNRTLRINFVLFDGVLLDESENHHWKLIKSDPLLKSLLK